MNFKRPELELEFDLATQAELRDVCRAVDRELQVRMLPQLVATCGGRTVEENAAAAGVPTSLHLWEPDEVEGRPKRTRAWDLSIRPYSPTQLEEVRAIFLAELRKRGRTRFEFLVHDVGSGRHIHVGIKRGQQGAL